MPLLFPIYTVDFFTNLWYNHFVSERQIPFLKVRGVYEKFKYKSKNLLIFSNNIYDINFCWWNIIIYR